MRSPVIFGVADQTRRTADEGEGPVARVLQAAHGEDLDEVADVQARRRRVEAAVAA